MFVVGKLNAAKVANFSEIGGWVVIGCWESSLVDSKDFWKPVITPFELELALKDDADRVWTGAWQSDFQAVLDQPAQEASGDSRRHPMVPCLKKMTCQNPNRRRPNSTCVPDDTSHIPVRCGIPCPALPSLMDHLPWAIRC